MKHKFKVTVEYDANPTVDKELMRSWVMLHIAESLAKAPENTAQSFKIHSVTAGCKVNSEAVSVTYLTKDFL